MVETKLVAIVNVTPDSFSDGGQHFDPNAALTAIEGFIQDGADVIDIGAESTRPGATPISQEEEWKRLAPVMTQLRAFKDCGVIFSVDTRHSRTAQQALLHGIDWINDVSGFTSAPMVDAVKDSKCKLVMMHSLSVPADKSVVLPESADVVQELLEFASERVATLEKSGIARDRLIFDPGIGFGKTPRQSQEILNRADELMVLGMPLFIGHSRKSFLMMQAATNEDKDMATVAISRDLASHGVAYLRVHNIKLHRQMMKELKRVA